VHSDALLALVKITSVARCGSAELLDPFVNTEIILPASFEMGVWAGERCDRREKSVRVEMIGGLRVRCADHVRRPCPFCIVGGRRLACCEFGFLALIALTARGDKDEGTVDEVRGMVRAAGRPGPCRPVRCVAALTAVGPERLVANFAQEQDTQTAELLNNERFSRRDIWGATIAMIRDHPVTGVGLGAFQVAYPRYDPSSGTQRVEQSHNDYLQILADAESSAEQSRLPL
jgi:hypothetical protein